MEHWKARREETIWVFSLPGRVSGSNHLLQSRELLAGFGLALEYSKRSALEVVLEVSSQAGEEELQQIQASGARVLYSPSDDWRKQTIEIREFDPRRSVQFSSGMGMAAKIGYLEMLERTERERRILEEEVEALNRAKVEGTKQTLQSVESEMDEQLRRMFHFDPEDFRRQLWRDVYIASLGRGDAERIAAIAVEDWDRWHRKEREKEHGEHRVEKAAAEYLGSADDS